MNGVKISQIRWPYDLYEWLHNEAYERRQSLNQTVNELIKEARERSETFQPA